ncbi:MAG: DUF4097 family beta strand repeat-containing protein [Candidatus Poribacteria bacterium]|nr:DUF4097 family beta strand repeat-containing protein [Candidatus Poribacteria bacterium]
MTKSKRLVAFLVLPLLFLSVVIFVLFIGEVENTRTNRSGLTVNPTGRLTVDLEFGTINIDNIETTDQDHINIAYTKEWKAKFWALRLQSVKWISELPGDFEITTKNSDSDTQSDIQIKGKFKRGREHWREGLKWFTVDVRVTVPRRYSVTLKTASSGDIHVDNLIGAVSAEVLDGNLHLGEIQGEVSGKTSRSGGITLKGCQSSVNLTAALGNIRAEMTTQPQHPWTLHTSESGEIDVALHPDIAVNVDAQTQGNISSDFSIQPHRDVESRLKGAINGGGPLLKLRAAAGEIRLRRN